MILPNVSGVYQIKCLPTGKRYIGSSGNMRRRQQDHLGYLRRGAHFNPHLQRAFDKYSEIALAFRVLKKVPASNLLDEEQRWLPRAEFNIATVAGSPMAGRKASAATRAKLSVGRRGEKNNFFGRRHSATTKLKISEANSGRKHTASAIEKICKAMCGDKNPFFGRQHSAATRMKLSRLRKGRKAVNGKLVLCS